VDSRSGGRLPNTKGGPLYCPYTCLPAAKRGFIVDTNASNVGIGGVISHVQDGQERVTAYYNNTSNKAERNYCITQRKILAIVRTLEHFHKYLYGLQFHLRTDHSALTWFMRLMVVHLDRLAPYQGAARDERP
jgi:hypothetical protein